MHETREVAPLLYIYIIYVSKIAYYKFVLFISNEIQNALLLLQQPTLSHLTTVVHVYDAKNY